MKSRSKLKYRRLTGPRPDNSQSIKDNTPPKTDHPGYIRRVIRIRAEDSPNVRLALEQIKQGKRPTGEILIPGVLDYRTYLNRRKLWDPKRQCIGLDAEFYEGKEVMLYPEPWLTAAIENSRRKIKRRQALTMGVDSAEGNDSTCWTVIDLFGIMYQLSIKTKDTSDIPGRTIGLIREYGLRSENVLFDRGGGGKQHADVLRRNGFNVRTVGFGEPATDPSLEANTFKDRQEIVELKYAYRNRRAEMYGLLRRLLNPEIDHTLFNELVEFWANELEGDEEQLDFIDSSTIRFGISSEYDALLKQLAPLPLEYDNEGRMYLPPKNKKSRDSKEITLKEILGCSPDEADSLVLAVFGMCRPIEYATVGAIVL